MGFTKGDPPRDDLPRHNRGYDPNRPRARTNYDREAQCISSVWELIEARGRIATRDIFCNTQIGYYSIKEIDFALDVLQRVGKIVCDLEEGYARVCDPNRPRARSADEFSHAERYLITLLGKIEQQQERLAVINNELKVLLNGNRDLGAMWKKFESNGGTASAEQLKLFLRGEMRPRITRRVGNLRLISDRIEAKIVHRKLHDDDDDDGPNAA